MPLLVRQCVPYHVWRGVVEQVVSTFPSAFAIWSKIILFLMSDHTCDSLHPQPDLVRRLGHLTFWNCHSELVSRGAVHCWLRVWTRLLMMQVMSTVCHWTTEKEPSWCCVWQIVSLSGRMSAKWNHWVGDSSLLSDQWTSCHAVLAPLALRFFVSLSMVADESTNIHRHWFDCISLKFVDWRS